jgi:hypothetical protein
MTTITLKVCTKCDKEKPIDMFRVAHNACKECQRLTHAEWRSNNREKARAASNNWKKNNPEKAAEWQNNNREKTVIAAAKYYRNNKTKAIQSTRTRQVLNKERYAVMIKARGALHNALLYSRLIKPVVCEHCRVESDKLHGHHTDYSKPLEVIWLCTKCHGKQHRKEVVQDDRCSTTLT